MREDFARGTLLDLLALVHHQDAVGDLGDHTHVVGNENHPHVHLALQLTDQGKDLRLDRDIERRGRLIGDEQRRLAGQRHGDHHPLPHAAGQLVRIAIHHRAGLGNAHELQQAQCLGARGRRARPLVQPDRFRDLITGGEHRVERRHGLLEDHRHVRATHRAHHRGIGTDKIDELATAPAQRHRAADDAAAAVLDQAHQCQRCNRLSRARFADDRQRLAAIDMKGKPAHGIDGALGTREPNTQVADLNDTIRVNIHSGAHLR